MFNALNDQLDRIVDKLRQQPVFQWAVVTSVSPLQIRYDGATDPVAGSPASTVAGLQVGDRVWCQRIHRRDIILGKGGSDTGWQNLSINSPFAPYSPSGYLRWRRAGIAVELRGVITCNTAGHIEGYGARTIATLPTDARPSEAVHVICQGSEMGKWLLTVNPSGVVGASRYDTTQNAGVWLPLQATWTI